MGLFFYLKFKIAAIFHRMKLGFIGTGKIASSVIEGINHSKINYKRIIVSPRNKKIAIKLKKK